MTLDRRAIARDNRQISIQLELRANRALAREDLTGVQAQILLYILEAPNGTSLTAIHRDSGYSMPAISTLVKRLREKGYVRVEPCAADDRRKLLFGTDKGKQVQNFLDESIRETEDWLYQDFSAEDLATLDQLQKRMLHNLSALNHHRHREATKT